MFLDLLPQRLRAAREQRVQQPADRLDDLHIAGADQVDRRLLQRRGRPLLDEREQQAHHLLDEGHVPLAEVLDRLGPDLAVDLLHRQAQHVQHQLQDRRQRKVLRHLDPAFGHLPEQPLQEAGLQVLPDVVDELRQPLLDRRQQVLQEADRVGDDQVDGLLGLGQQGQDPVAEVAQDLDHLAQRVDQFLRQALVFVLDLLERGGPLVVGLVVALGQLLRQVVLLLVHALAQLVETFLHVLLGGLAHGLQVGRQALDVVVDLLLSRGDGVLRLLETRVDEVGHPDHQGVQLPGEHLVRLVEPVLDLVRQRQELVLQPQGLPEPAVPIVEAVRDVVAHLGDGVVGALVEDRADFRLQLGEFRVHRRLGARVDPLDVVGDLLAGGAPARRRRRRASRRAGRPARAARRPWRGPSPGSGSSARWPGRPSARRRPARPAPSWPSVWR